MKEEHKGECKGWRERGRETREGEASYPLTVSLASMAVGPGNSKVKVIRQSTPLPSVTGFQPSKSLWPTKAHLLLTASLLSNQQLFPFGKKKRWELEKGSGWEGNQSAVTPAAQGARGPTAWPVATSTLFPWVQQPDTASASFWPPVSVLHLGRQ